MHLNKDSEPWADYALPLSTPNLSPRARKICIVGAGIAGIASALVLAKELKPHEPHVQITVFERHDVLSTSGGAINLTPVAQRHLDRLGVLSELDRQGADGGADVDAIELFSSRSGRSLGSIDFTDGHGNGVNGYKGRRVMRIVLSLAMLAAVERQPCIRIVYGKKLTGVIEQTDQTILHFADNTSAAGDLVLGCDGVHSTLRTQYVDPERLSEYTGLSFLQTIIDTPPPSTRTRLDCPSGGTHNFNKSKNPSKPSFRTHSYPSTPTPCPVEQTQPIRHAPPFTTTGLAISRHGDLLASYCDRNYSNLFLAAILQIEESLLSNFHLKPTSQSQYPEPRRRIAIQNALQSEIRSRFAGSGHPWIRDVANLQTNWMLYPVYQVKPGGRWWKGRVILLGDAAHAMPPRDESAAYALDDAIMFCRTLAHSRDKPLTEVFSEYESLRRGPVEDAFLAASRMWAMHRDMGFLEGRWKEWTIPWVLWKNRDVRNAAWNFDVYDV